MTTTIQETINLDSPLVFIKQASWERFEFHTRDELFVEEADVTTDHFALESSLEDGETVQRVFVANSDDYSIHEDVTYHFEERLDALVGLLRTLPNKDHTEFYNEWLKSEEE